MTKVVIFGCQKICIEFIDYLRRNAQIYTVPIVFTSERKSDKNLPYKSIISYCKKKKINFKNSKKLGNKEINLIKKAKPDIIFSIYYRYFIPIEILNIPTIGSYNIHPSLLPLYKGSTPTAWAIINNENYFGITVHKLTKNLDSGDIYYQKKIPIKKNETGFELNNRAMTIGLKILKNNFKKLINKKLIPSKQNSKGTFYKKIPSSNQINWATESQSIFNKFRVYAHPFSGSFSKIKNRKIHINCLKILNNKNVKLYDHGRITRVYSNFSFIVSCKKGLIHVLDYNFSRKLNKFELNKYIRVGNKLI